MAAHSDAGRIGVWGRSGSGKSTRAKAIIAKAARAVVFDTQREYGELAGFVTANTIDQVRQEMAKRWRGSFKIAYVPPAGNEKAALDRLSKLLRLAQTPFFEGSDQRQLSFLVEEMWKSYPVTSLPADMQGFTLLCSEGRHYGIELIGVSQRIAAVSTNFRGNCTETYVFRQKGPRDIKAAADELGDVQPAQIQALQPHHYIHEKDGAITFGKN